MAASLLTQDDLTSIIQNSFAHSPDAILITDTSVDAIGGPKIMYVNDEVERLAVHVPDGIVPGRRIGDIYPKELAVQAIRQFQEVAQKRRSVIAERSIQGRWFSILVTPVLGRDGLIHNFVSVGHDIHVLKKADQERQKTQELLAGLFKVIDRALAVIDDHGRFSMINTGLTKQFGWSAAELTGKPVTNIIVEQDRSTLLARLYRVEQEGQTGRTTVGLLHRDGSITSVDIISAIIGETGSQSYHVLALVPQSAPQPSGAPDQFRPMLRGGPTGDFIVAGRLQLIGLDAVRERMGERWPSVSARIFVLAERILRKHLTATDVVERVQDDGFLVCFGDLTEHEAQFKAHAIGQEIVEHLIGDVSEASKVNVRTFAAAIPLAADEVANPQDLAGLLGTRLAAERKRCEGEAHDTMLAALSAAEAIFQPVRKDAHQMSSFQFARLPPDLDRALSILESLGQKERRIDTELLLLTGGAEQALAAAAQHLANTVIVPIHMETLTHRRDAEQWLTLARQIGKVSRDHMVIEIAGLGRDTPQGRIAELLMLVNPIFHGVAFELPTSDPAFLTCLPPSSHLTTIAVGKLGEEAEQAKNAAKLLKFLSLRKGQLLVKEVGTMRQAMSLSQAGVPLLLMTQASWQ